MSPTIRELSRSFKTCHQSSNRVDNLLNGVANLSSYVASLSKGVANLQKYVKMAVNYRQVHVTHSKSRQHETAKLQREYLIILISEYPLTLSIIAAFSGSMSVIPIKFRESIILQFQYKQLNLDKKTRKGVKAAKTTDNFCFFPFECKSNPLG